MINKLLKSMHTSFLDKLACRGGLLKIPCSFIVIGYRNCFHGQAFFPQLLLSYGGWGSLDMLNSSMCKYWHDYFTNWEQFLVSPHTFKLLNKLSWLVWNIVNSQKLPNPCTFSPFLKKTQIWKKKRGWVLSQFFAF